MDYMVRATAADDQIRLFAATTKELVEYARAAHGTSTIATAALGRTMTAAVMMGTMMKEDKALVTVQIKGDGPIGEILVTADSKGHVKGYVSNPDVWLPKNERGKLNVGGAVGSGTMRVIRDLGMKEPYIGMIELQSGEIADDFTYYFATSEQIPSSVGLGVLVNEDQSVREAGGFIVQLMPGTSIEMIEKLEQTLSTIDSVTDMLKSGMSPEDMVGYILGDIEFRIMEKTELSFKCGCSVEKLEKTLMSLGRKELENMIQENVPIDVCCHFCSKHYNFEVEDLKRIFEQAK